MSNHADEAFSSETQQTPAQWAVRWHGVVFAAALLLSVPVVHLGWHVALGHEKPALQTRSQVERPVPTWDGVLAGSWMTKVENYLREASPIAWWLRGEWNEWLWCCGILQSDEVQMGRDRWLFLKATLHEHRQQFAREATARRRFFAEVRDAVRASGAELVISLVPDKARVYPDFAFRDGVISPAKEPIYGMALQEFRELGIPTADLASALAVARAAMPGVALYYARDTHWRPQGALAGAGAVAAAIESLPVAATLVPRRPAGLGTGSTVSALGDLVSMLGLLTCELPFGADRSRTHPLSLFTTELLEDREYYSAVLHTDGGTIDPLVSDAGNDIVLLGTSFSEANGAGGLALSLGRPVRAILGHGASGMAPLHTFAAELKRGTKAKVVVWEIVERGLFEVDWATAQL